MKIGIIVATRKEREAFYEVFGAPHTEHTGSKHFDVSIWWLGINKRAYLITSGVGEIAAAICTQYLIDKFEVDKVINYGVVGGLTEDCTARKVGIIEKVIHYDFDISFGSHYSIGEYPGEGRFLQPAQDTFPSSVTVELNRFICASGDKIVAGGEPKRKLREEFGADICEMEAAGIVRTCNRNDVPCALVKAISDGVDEDTEAFDQNVYEASKNCVKLIAELI